MVKFRSHLAQLWHRRKYTAIALVVSLVLILGQPLVAYSISWGDLLFRGIQVLQLSNISDRQEVEIGRQINEQLISQKIRLYRDPQVTQYVEQIGQRLARTSKRPDLPYTFQVVDDRGVNAFATMGGFVYVNTGLLRLAANEAELASVMAHEIGHVAGRHAVKQLRETAIASGLVGAAGLDRNVAARIGVELAFRRPNSRRDEYDADLLGLNNLTQAGYAPIAMVDFMQKLLRSSSVPTFLSTHPGTSERIERLQQALPNGSSEYGDGLDPALYRARLRSLS